MWCRRCSRQVPAESDKNAPSVCPFCGGTVEAVSSQSQAIRRAKEILQKWQASDLFDRISGEETPDHEERQQRPAIPEITWDPKVPAAGSHPESASAGAACSSTPEISSSSSAASLPAMQQRISSKTDFDSDATSDLSPTPLATKASLPAVVAQETGARTAADETAGVVRSVPLLPEAIFANVAATSETGSASATASAWQRQEAPAAVATGIEVTEAEQPVKTTTIDDVEPPNSEQLNEDLLHSALNLMFENGELDSAETANSTDAQTHTEQQTNATANVEGLSAAGTSDAERDLEFPPGIGPSPVEFVEFAKADYAGDDSSADSEKNQPSADSETRDDPTNVETTASSVIQQEEQSDRLSESTAEHLLPSETDEFQRESACDDVTNDKSLVAADLSHAAAPPVAETVADSDLQLSDEGGLTNALAEVEQSGDGSANGNSDSEMNAAGDCGSAQTPPDLPLAAGSAFDDAEASAQSAAANNRDSRAAEESTEPPEGDELPSRILRFEQSDSENEPVRNLPATAASAETVSAHSNESAALIGKNGKMTSMIGQSLAYIGVLGLTAGGCLVVYGYFGGHPQYIPTGWLVTMVSQMLLFLGVINLVTGGMEQSTAQLNARIDDLSDQLLRIECTSAESTVRKSAESFEDKTPVPLQSVFEIRKHSESA